MKISTKGRYALRVMLDLAVCEEGEFISLKEISDRQEISRKYLEMIVSMLNRAGYVVSLRGKSGGYRLAKKPEEYTVGAILKLTEGSMSPVTCLDCRGENCNRADSCLTLPLWENLDHLIDEYLESVTLEDLLNQTEALHQNPGAKK